MLYYLVRAGTPAQGTIHNFLDNLAPDARNFIRPVYYEDVFNNRIMPCGSCIFSDLERLTHHELEAAAIIWNRMSQKHDDIELLNHPLRSLCRYELLRVLYENGYNSFNVFRLTERRLPERYPVFIRGEHDHNGSETELLNTTDEFQEALNNLSKHNKSRDGRLVVEFCAKPDEYQLYRKYAAYIVGGELIPRQVLFSTHWMIKGGDTVNDATIKIETDYLQTNPHQAELRKIFELANIEYGRIDYSVVNGQIQTYEINTNPSIGAAKLDNPHREKVKRDFITCLIAALRVLDKSTVNKEFVKIPLKMNPTKPWQEKPRGLHKLWRRLIATVSKRKY